MGEVWIELGPDEVAIAELIGKRRVDTCIAAGSEHRHYDGDDYGTNVRQNQHAAGGEIAVCKALGGWWSAIGGKGAENAGADVIVGTQKVQVRHSQYQRGFMCVYPEDDGGLPFVFVVGELPRFRIAGWIWGKDAQVAERWSEVNPRTAMPLRCACFIIEQVSLASLAPRA